MAKLDITASQIQSTTNMILSGDTVTTWSDDKYPSAKAAFDNAHPIGSIIITNTNTNPAAAINDTRAWLGGTWELVDKEYKAAVGANVYWTPAMNGSTPSAEATGFVTRTDHLIHLYSQITTKIAISTASTSYTLGSFDHDMIGGAPNTPISFGYSDSNFTNAVYTKHSTTESCMVRYGFSWDGGFTVYEIFNTDKQLPANALIYLNTSIKMSPEYMGDSFCDKFYWKRTA